MDRKIIDVSTWQGVVDWAKVKSKVDGVIIRCGFGGNVVNQDDNRYKFNADECSRLEIPFGVYLYSYAKNIEQAKDEAEHVLRLVKGYKLSYPIYIDIEESISAPKAKEIVDAFADVVENAGYVCGVYSSLNWWNTHLKGYDRLTKWVAHWADECGYKGNDLDMWQYTSSASIEGINGNVDMSHCYRDFPKEINANKDKYCYTVTCGSFIYEDNAKDLAKKFKKLGYECEVIKTKLK